MTLNEIVKLTMLWTTGPRMTIAKEHLGCFNHDENMFLNCIVTGNEMWVRYAEPETKAQQKQWKQAGSILANFMPKGRTVTARYYSEAILKKKKKNQRKTEEVASQASPEKCPSFAWQYPLSYCLIYRRTYQLLQVAIVFQLSLQPRRCPCDFCLFPKLKKRRIINKYETRVALDHWAHSVTFVCFQNCFRIQNRKK